MQKRVFFYNRQGERLSGRLFAPSGTEMSPGVVLCNGFTSSKYRRTGIAQRLSMKGFAVLTFDASGTGESAGSFQEHTVTKYVGELRSAVNFMKSLDFVDKERIGISGNSLGGMVVIIYASKYRDIRVAIPVAAPYHLLKDRGKSLDFGEKEFLDNWKKQGYKVFNVRIKERRVPKRLSYNFIKDSKKYDLSRIIAKVRCPVVIVHGDKDDTVPLRHAKILFSAARRPKKLVVIKGAGHFFKTEHERRKPEKFIEAALSRYLSP